MAASAPKVLVVDDHPAICTALSVLFEIHDIGCIAARSPEGALAALSRHDIGLVIHDMNFRADTTSGREGIELFRAIKARDPDLPVLLMTAWTDVETAVQVIKQGADDYIGKPWDDDKLLSTVRDLLRVRTMRRENARLRTGDAQSRLQLAKQYDLRGLVYQSGTMHSVVSLALTVAKSDAPILITGPNGSGKEKLAELVQANSPRCTAPFITVNAGGLPDELLEAELFGAEAGAYTGAQKRRIGRFEAANSGTLFLDEIGNLSSGGQMKLLRALETGEFQRLGSSDTRKVDVRILSATNADLHAAIAAGRFREDLYYRLSVIELKIPPLAARSEDVLPLARSFLNRFSPLDNDVPWAFGDDAIGALRAHSWPGNVRELRNRVQRAVLVAAARSITAADLGLIGGESTLRPGINSTAHSLPRSLDRGQLTAEDAEEKHRIEEAIIAAGGVMSKAARALGISRQALYRRIDKLGISIERRPVRKRD
ncbi:MAG: sigma-54 dependent transcriptional regulator [Proteobacteria bacterium]|nr:sigma-54 dependent transcriptional regulator [Pseudomonadota bacterium]